jgi:hypothetical protein
MKRTHMDNEFKQNEGESISKRTGSITGKMSGLNKRGLKFIHGSKKQQVLVIIGCCDDGIGEYLSDLVKEACKNKYDLKVSISYYSEEILEIADKEAIDIFILILNNLNCSNFPYEERIEKNLQLITQIKGKYNRPVIALFGYCNLSDVIRAMNTADLVFILPIVQEAFREAVEKYLEILPC